MAREFALSVVAPDRSVVEDRAVTMVAPGADGYFGVMAGHEPLIASIRTGVLEYQDTRGTRHHVAIGGGFAEVTPDHVTVLADTAERAEEIDAAAAERTLEEARRALRGEATTMTAEQAAAEVDRAVNRLRAARMRQ